MPSSSDDDWDASSSEDRPVTKVVPVVPVADGKVMKKDAVAVIEHLDTTGMSKAQRKALGRVTETEGNMSAFNFESDLRSPIVCIMGHVDTGKTKLLDKIRSTNVQKDEVGGITQQIGATFFPRQNLLEHAKKVHQNMEIKVPGLLIIDTPGHESFSNLRSRGSSLCDIAILVVDIMHGLEAQTLESLKMLLEKDAKFVVALNKVDRLYDWKVNAWSPIQSTLKKQNKSVNDEFEERWRPIQHQFWDQGLDSDICWRVKDPRKQLVVIPTSAHTGEGIPDLLSYLVAMNQRMLAKRIAYSDKFEATVLERKNVTGYGTTVDAIVVNGRLKVGDTVVLSSMNDPIVTTVRLILTPKPMSEIRVKGAYLIHEEIKAAMTVKLVANGLEEVLAGTPMMRAGECGTVPTEEELQIAVDSVSKEVADIFKSVQKSGKGVFVQASTLGSLEALLQFLKDSKIPVHAVNVGNVSARDVKIASTMRDAGHPEFAVMLCFDVELSADAEREAKQSGVTIFRADIIYHLQNQYKAFRDKQIADQKEALMKEAVFPCVIELLDCFNRRAPLLLGARVTHGVAKIGTPLMVYVDGKEVVEIGNISSIQTGPTHKEVQELKENQEGAIKVEGKTQIQFGKHFKNGDGPIVSQITRESINCLKKFFRDDMTDDLWRLIIKLKKQQGV